MKIVIPITFYQILFGIHFLIHALPGITLQNVEAQEEGLTVVSVGKAELEKITFGLYGNSSVAGMADVKAIIGSDLNFYKRYLDVKEVSSPEKATLVLETLEKKNGTYLLKARVRHNQTENLLEASGSNLREVSHHLADKTYQQLFSKPSIFLSKIYFVSDQGTTKAHPMKELYVMDFDGHNVKRLTNHRGTVISPAVSYSRRWVLYSLIKSSLHNRNIDLYILDTDSGEHKMLSNLQGINSGAVFLPGDEKIVLTLSHQGNAEIYIMNLKSKALIRLTDNPAPDVDPDFSINGDMMTFLSGRPGKAEIYTMDPSGVEKNVSRISYVGEFNATPRFSPDAKLIVFSSWMDSHFDIFRINANGSGLYRLTKDFGSNEDPTFSPDGEFVAFTSQRVLSRTKAQQTIYIMDKDGELIGPVTSNIGNCISPRWSK